MYPEWGAPLKRAPVIKLNPCVEEEQYYSYYCALFPQEYSQQEVNLGRPEFELSTRSQLITTEVRFFPFETLWENDFPSKASVLINYMYSQVQNCNIFKMKWKWKLHLLFLLKRSAAFCCQNYYVHVAALKSKRVHVTRGKDTGQG